MLYDQAGSTSREASERQETELKGEREIQLGCGGRGELIGKLKMMTLASIK